MIGRTEAMNERPKYQAAILEIILQNAKLFRPGTIREITVAHDSWCRLFNADFRGGILTNTSFGGITVSTAKRGVSAG
jgi:hypothetical protein